jgi:hypothetical protein
MSVTWTQRDGRLYGEVSGLRFELHPLHGPTEVRLEGFTTVLPQLLGVEIVSAKRLGQLPLADNGELPEVVCRDNTALATYRPTPQRPVECQARWQFSPARIDLEVSALTPGRWSGLAVQTRSLLPPGEMIRPWHDRLVYIHRMLESSLTYAEMCHPEDGIGLELAERRASFALFGHDLEKGVILRGRVRGVVVARPGDEAAVLAEYQRFLAAEPNLSI